MTFPSVSTELFFPVLPLDRSNCGLKFFRRVGDPILPTGALPNPSIWSLHVLSPLFQVFQLMSSPWVLGPSCFCWLFLLPISHCYTILFNSLSLCISPLSPHTPDSAPFFHFPLLSSFKVPLTLYLQWLFCLTFYVGLKHPLFSLPSSWASYGL